MQIISNFIVSNINTLQTKIIPYLESWTYDNKAIFNPKKTILIYFLRNKFKLIAEDAASVYIQFGQKTIKPKSDLKLLRVVFDQKLTYKYHIAKATKISIKAALVIKL